MDIEFDNLEELKKRITPALKTKVKELKNKNYNLITTEDIWDYLIKYKWRTSKNLTLYDIINDILKIDENNIEEFAIKRREQND